jgi:AcrR family transcriptional regulator
MTATNGQEGDELRAGGWRTSRSPELSTILAAALDAFHQHGYHGTSVRDIAKRVGVTVPALYYHHENKEAILFALLDDSIGWLTGVCEAALTDAGDDPEVRFTNMVEAIVLYMAHSTKLAGLDAEIRSLSAGNRATYSERRRRIEQMLVDTVQAGRSSGAFDVTSPQDSARALLGMFQAVATWYRPGGTLPPQSLAHRYVDIAVHAVGASPDLIERVRAAAA